MHVVAKPPGPRRVDDDFVIDLGFLARTGELNGTEALFATLELEGVGLQARLSAFRRQNRQRLDYFTP